jgi:hypothetical protein
MTGAGDPLLPAGELGLRQLLAEPQDELLAPCLGEGGDGERPGGTATPDQARVQRQLEPGFERDPGARVRRVFGQEDPRQVAAQLDRLVMKGEQFRPGLGSLYWKFKFPDG